MADRVKYRVTVEVEIEGDGVQSGQWNLNDMALFHVTGGDMAMGALPHGITVHTRRINTEDLGAI